MDDVESSRDPIMYAVLRHAITQYSVQTSSGQILEKSLPRAECTRANKTQRSSVRNFESVTHLLHSTSSNPKSLIVSPFLKCFFSEIVEEIADCCSSSRKRRYRRGRCAPNRYIDRAMCM